MDFCSIPKTLSDEVEKEIDSLVKDDSFRFKSQEVFQSFSYEISSFGAMNANFCGVDFDSNAFSLNSLELRKDDIGENLSAGEETPDAQVSHQKLQVGHKEKIHYKQEFSRRIDNTNAKRGDEQALHHEAAQASSEEEPKTQSNSNSVKFLSLKRTDVVMKSIFRMMRRYYSQLIEDITGYDRKEKQ